MQKVLNVGFVGISRSSKIFSVMSMKKALRTLSQFIVLPVIVTNT